MAERERKDDPIVNQARVRDQTIARSEHDVNDDDVLYINSPAEARTRYLSASEQGAQAEPALGHRG
jgi:hypothetical protein